jgi:hypothetical protein
MRLSSLFAFAGKNRLQRHQPAARRSRPQLECLESRTVLTITFSNPATMSGVATITGTSAADQFIVRLGTPSTTNQTIQFSDNGGKSFVTTSLAGITAINVNGQGGGDTLTLDMSNGLVGETAAALPITYDAGVKGRGALVIKGTPPSATGAISEVFTAGANSTAGTVTLSATGATAGASSSSVTFTNLSLLQDTLSAASLTVNGPSGNSLIALRNGPNVNGFRTDIIQGVNSARTGEGEREGEDEDNNGNQSNTMGNTAAMGNGFVPIEFANKTTVNVNGQAGDDVVVLDATKAAAGLKTLNLNGGGGNNVLLDLNRPSGVTVNLQNFQQTITDPKDAFIEDLFIRDLGWPASASDLAFWRGVLDSSGRAAIINGIEESQEGIDQLVRSLYRQFLNRDARNGEEMFWVNQMLLGQTQEQILAGIIGSQEFYDFAQTRVTTGTPDQRFITEVYQVLFARAPRADELTYWTNLLQGQSRTQAVLQFLQSPQFRTDVITALYNQFLGRNPDNGGLAFWRDSNMSLGAVRQGILSSGEFSSNEFDSGDGGPGD